MSASAIADIESANIPTRRRSTLLMTMEEKRRIAPVREKALTEKATAAERRMIRLLDGIGMLYKFQRSFFAGDNFAIADFWLLKYRICIEVDGGYHNTDTAQARDAERTKYLTRKRGATVIRFTNEEVMKMNPRELAYKISNTARSNNKQIEYSNHEDNIREMQRIERIKRKGGRDPGRISKGIDFEGMNI